MTTFSHTTLRPLHQFHDLAERAVIADRILDAVKTDTFKQQLEKRNLGHVLQNQFGARHHEVLQNYVKATQQHRARELGSFVILSADELFQGIATVDPLSVIHRHRTALTPPLFRSRLVKDVYPTGPRLSAWTIPNGTRQQSDALMAAYTALKDPNGLAADFYQVYEEHKPEQAQDVPLASYTIEPIDTPSWVRASIEQAKLFEVDRGYFDTSLSRFAQPVMSKRYIAQTA